MKRILRSMVDVNGTPNQEQLKGNYFVFVESKLQFIMDQDTDIWGYIKDFFNESREGELPSLQSLVDYFETAGRPDVLDRLKDIRESPPYIRSNFLRLTKDLYVEQQSRKLDNLIREMGKGKDAPLVKGVRSAVENFISKADELLTVEAKGKLKGDVTADGQEVLTEYHAKKNNPKIGRSFGLQHMDNFTKGLRSGELMLILGYVGELKTGLSLNYAYNTAIYFDWNVMYFSLEMKYEQVRNILHCIHSTHAKFKRHNGDTRALDYGRLRDGALTPDEEALLVDVAADFTEQQGRGYGKIIVERPVSALSVSAIKLKAEVEHRKHGLGLIIADHAGLIEGEEGRSVSNFGVSLNYVIKDLSQLALNFNDGEGIPVCTPFQASRAGWKEACKNDGNYKLDALSWANEAERSASLIISTFLGDDDKLRKANEVQIGCLKNRDGGHFKTFKAHIDFLSRRIRHQDESTGGGGLEDLGFDEPI